MDKRARHTDLKETGNFSTKNGEETQQQWYIVDFTTGRKELRPISKRRIDFAAVSKLGTISEENQEASPREPQSTEQMSQTSPQDRIKHAYEDYRSRIMQESPSSSAQEHWERRTWLRQAYKDLNPDRVVPRERPLDSTRSNQNDSPQDHYSNPSYEQWLRLREFYTGVINRSCEEYRQVIIDTSSDDKERQRRLKELADLQNRLCNPEYKENQAEEEYQRWKPWIMLERYREDVEIKSNNYHLDESNSEIQRSRERQKYESIKATYRFNENHMPKTPPLPDNLPWLGTREDLLAERPSQPKEDTTQVYQAVMSGLDFVIGSPILPPSWRERVKSFKIFWKRFELGQIYQALCRQSIVSVSSSVELPSALDRQGSRVTDPELGQP